ncbi:MAG: hypothetical protein IJP76_01805 [Paludibacteraceae bacterium]|nr:hypothetical protein [Paludibacteraceae bacterium]
MNRQAANYVESVGDKTHYEWQTPWHNRMWLCITIAILAGVFWVFIKQNEIHEEELSISLQKTDTFSAPLKACDIEIRYDYSGDFSYSPIGKVKTKNKQGEYEDVKDFVWVYATITPMEIDTKPFYSKVPKNYKMNHKYGERPERILVERILDCDMSLNTLYRPVINNEMQKITGKNTKKHPYQQRYINPNALVDYTAYVEGDVIKMHSTSQVYSKSLLKNKKVCVAISPKNIVYADRASGRTIGQKTIPGEYRMMDIDEYEKYLSTNFKPHQVDSISAEVLAEKFFSTRVNSSYNRKDTLDMFHGRNPIALTNRNVSCVRINRGGLKLPDAQKQGFHIRYQAPMIFENVSITPDLQTENTLSYTSPEKLKLINQEGLIVVARSLANANIQDTLNFVYATLIGLIFSFFVEFNKRLYNYHRQKVYASGEKYIPIVSVLRSMIKPIVNGTTYVVLWCGQKLKKGKMEHEIKSDTDHETGN